MALILEMLSLRVAPVIGLILYAWLGSPLQLEAKVVAPFLAPQVPSGTMSVTLHPTEVVTVGSKQLITFGVPFTRGSLTPANVSTIRVFDGDQEIPAYVEMLTPWRHLTDAAIDGKFVRFARVQISRTFSSVAPKIISVDWGVAPRSANVSTYQNERSGWHTVTSGSYVASDGIMEPNVYAVLPREVLCQGALKLTRMTPFSTSITETRDDPVSIDATGTWPAFEEMDRSIKNNFYTLINEDDLLVTTVNSCLYKTDSEPWLYDRASAMYVFYQRSGFYRALRESVRNAQYYQSKLFTSPLNTGPGERYQAGTGIFSLKQPDRNAVSGGNDAMYSYAECLAYTYWLTGDETMKSAIDRTVYAHERYSEPTRWSASSSTWTERHTGFTLLNNVIAYEVFGDSYLGANYKSNLLGHKDNFVWHQNGAGGALPSNRTDGGLYHLGAQHGDGENGVLVASSWMTAIIGDAMLRVYALSETAEIANFIIRVGNFQHAASRFDADHSYDGFDMPLYHSDYMMRFDGQPDRLDGRQFEMVEHSAEISTTLAWAGYFSELLNAPDPRFVQRAREVYFSYDVGVNHWVRPLGPTAGRAAFRITPFRKYGWEHRPSGSLSWLMGQLEYNGEVKQSIATSSGSNIDLTISGPPGQAYRIQRSSDLTNWTTWKRIQFDGVTSTKTESESRTDSRMFYRTIWE
jgi:hypothetical protein